MMAGFGLMSVLLIVIGIQITFSVMSTKDSTTNMVENQQPIVISTMKLAEDIHHALGSLGLFMMSNDEIQKETFLKQLNEIDEIISDLKSKDEIQANPQALKLVNEIESDVNKGLKGYQERMFELQANWVENYPGIGYSARYINPIIQNILAHMDTMITSENEQKAKNEPLLQNMYEMRYAWVRAMSGVRGFLATRDIATLEEVNDFREYFNTLLLNIEKEHKNGLTFEQDNALEEIITLNNKFDLPWKEVQKIHGGDGWRQDAYLVRNEISPILNVLTENVKKLTDLQLGNIQSISSSLISEASNTTLLVILVLSVALLALAGLAYMLMHKILDPLTIAVKEGMGHIHMVMETYSKNIQQDIVDEEDNGGENNGNDAISEVSHTFKIMTDTLQKVLHRETEVTEDLQGKIEMIHEIVEMAAEGDLTGDMMVFSGGEKIDELAAGVKTMMENLNALVAQVQQSGIQVTSSATEIAATAKEQEATVTEQAASTCQIMATITEITATSKELSSTMGEVSGVAEATATSAAEGQESLSSMEATMHSMKDATSSISSKLAVLNEKAGNISTVVTTINKVADQTNLLSLNAAIEAEKAGEYGRGFAVVATEIRRLADQTAVATWDIEQMVKEMQSAVSAGVMGMDKFSEEINRGAEEVSQVGGQLGQIIEQVQTLIPRFDSVTHGMKFQTEGSEQISDSMSQLNDTAQQTAESLRQSSHSIAQLKDAAQGLQQGVSKFTVSRS
jgi:methyl-accepting chemotaxis protein